MPPAPAQRAQSYTGDATAGRLPIATLDNMSNFETIAGFALHLNAGALRTSVPLSNLLLFAWFYCLPADGRRLSSVNIKHLATTQFLYRAELKVTNADLPSWLFSPERAIQFLAAGQTPVSSSDSLQGSSWAALCACAHSCLYHCSLPHD